MSPSPHPSEPHVSPSTGGGATEKKYKGVRLRKWRKWVSEIRLPNSRARIWLGSYDTPKKAARAFDAAFVCLRGTGSEARLNFPDSPPAVGRNSDPQEVVAAAVSYANRGATPAGVAAAPAEAADSHVSMRNNAVVPPVQVPDRSLEYWSQLPLFSPTVPGSTPMSPPVSPVDDMEENVHGVLWSFDL